MADGRRAVQRRDGAAAAPGAGANPRPRTGRRPGDPGTRDAILAAARAEFGARGFDHATIRAIAGAARVDPALVHHYFGTKEELFEASLVLPMEPAAVLPELLRADPDHVGEGVVRTFLRTWEAPANRPTFMAMLRSVVGDEAAAALVRDLLTRSVFGPLATTLPAPDAALRATLVGTQLIGLALARYVGRVEPLASADVDTLAAAVGPTVQRYLLGDIGL
jgi:AcrR family transcriptional regulator